MSNTKENKTKSKDLSNNNTLTLNNRLEIKDFITSIFKENQKLKQFQGQVFELSKTYEDINDNLFDSIKNIQTIFESKADSSTEADKEFVAKYQDLVQNVEKTIQTKQEEYMNMLKAKDDQIEMINEENLELTSEMDARKKDRLKDQHIISQLEDENRQLKEMVIELAEQNESMSNKNLVKNLNSELGKKKAKGGDKRVEPMKKTVDQILKKMEANFDMNDKDNANMLQAIHKTIK